MNTHFLCDSLWLKKEVREINEVRRTPKPPFSMLKRELKIFLTSLMFFTRLPVWRLSEFTQASHSKASRYLPMVGWIVGGVAALVFWLAAQVLPLNIAVIISMGSTFCSLVLFTKMVSPMCAMALVAATLPSKGSR